MYLKILYIALVIGTGLFFLVMGSRNALYMRNTTKKPKLFSGPRVSVLVPARNEEHRIGPCLDGLTRQNYADFEVIFLDDRSNDGTRNLIELGIGPHPEFRIVDGIPRPEGWNGKQWALAQLAKEADGEILLFLDADMAPKPDFIAWVVSNMAAHDIDSLSAYARHSIGSFGEALLSPVFYMPTMNIVRLWKSLDNRSPRDCHAIGQIFAFRREAYVSSGGYDAVRGYINEDVAMARRMKSCGFRHLFLDAKDVLTGRLYDSFGDAVRGLRRIQLEYFDGSVLTLGLIIILLGGLVLSPPVVAVLGLLSGRVVPVGIWLGMGAFLSAWATVLWDRGQKWFVPFLYPIQFAVMAWVCLSSIIDGVSGRGYVWKGRVVNCTRTEGS